MDFGRYFSFKTDNIERMPSKGNNILYKVAAGNKRYIIKQYSALRGDNWEPDKTEFKALSVLSKMGLPVPKPFAFDETNHIGIYSFEEGRVLAASEIGRRDIKNVAEFLAELYSFNAETKKLFGFGKTTCLSMQDYAALLHRRYDALVKDFSGDEKSKSFLTENVRARIEEVTSDILRGSSSSRELTLEEQVVTPGDFGFHNVLVGNHRKCTFIDFEYCGRDDPAKQVLDFLHHATSSSIPRQLRGAFLVYHAQKFRPDSQFNHRLEVLDPAIGLHWVLIYLNVLSKKYLEHMAFSGHDLKKLRDERIEKAKTKLDNLTFFNRKD